MKNYQQNTSVLTIMAIFFLTMLGCGPAQQSSSQDTSSNGIISGETIDNLEVKFHTIKEASKLISSLEKDPSAQDLSLTLEEIDSWFVKPDEESQFMNFKKQQLSKLRKQVVKEVQSFEVPQKRWARGRDHS